MNDSNIEIALVVEVDGLLCKAVTFDDMNQSTYIHDGEIIKNTSVNSFVIIQQNYIKIVGRVNSESIWDMQSSNKNYNLDSRFKKNTIRRVLTIQVVGFISNQKFNIGASYIPMIGNVCSIPLTDELRQIYVNSFEESKREKYLSIGKSQNEQLSVRIPINSFFASHIGIFGNTGSGKSNTLHKLYYELFNQPFIFLKSKSRFVVLDFNGEYVHESSFGIISDEKEIFLLESRKESINKLPIRKSVFYNADILSVLFLAKPQTQKPFLSRVIKGIRKYGEGVASLNNWVVFLIRSIMMGEPNVTLRDRLIDTLVEFYPDLDEQCGPLRSTICYCKDSVNKFALPLSKRNWFFFDGNWDNEKIEALNINTIERTILNQELSSFDDFHLRCKLQLVRDLLYGNVIPDHIDPLIRIIDEKIFNMDNYLSLIDSARDKPLKFLEIISLRNLNQEAKQIGSFPELLKILLY